MSKIVSFISGNAAVVGGGVAVTAAAVVALVASGVLDTPQPPAPNVEEAAVVAPTQTENADGEDAPEVVDATSEPEPAPVAVVASESAVEAPGFDLVRIAPDGEGQIAGTASRNSLVALLLDGEEIASTQADDSGKFFTFITLGASAQPRELTLVERRDDGDVLSDSAFFVAPIQSPAEAVAIVTKEPDVEPSEEPQVVAEAAAPLEEQPAVEVDTETFVQPAEDATEEAVTETVDLAAAETPKAPVEAATAEAVQTVETLAESVPDAVAKEVVEPVGEEVAKLDVGEPPKAPAVLVSDADGVRVVQPAAPETADPEVVSAVSIDAISYGVTGEVVVAGRAGGEGFVRLYLNNELTATTPVDAAGQWQVGLTDVASGLYTMRADEVDGAGQVMSRIETPFKREAPERVALAQKQEQEAAEQVATVSEPAASQTSETAPEVVPTAPEAETPVVKTPAVQIVTVQPGFTLWAIARERYGEGPMYVRVYEANKDKIRDPDLIYPGQVFTVPE
ncbi:MAG: LysM peptidoglycan-binding domain-containing protein [Shimia sp.]|uniref:LysM peptidoglycan-binding domain-containing protein n=1 Tax=Shimia sp. TaxID=1954381 RepID=UPI00405A3A0F